MMSKRKRPESTKMPKKMPHLIRYDEWVSALGVTSDDPNYTIEHGWYSVADLAKLLGVTDQMVYARLRRRIAAGNSGIQSHKTVRYDVFGRPHATTVYKLNREPNGK